MDVDVTGALVILDEAHNVEDTSREAASCDVHLHDLQMAAAEFARVAEEESADGLESADGADSGPALLARALGSVARWVAGASDQENPRCPLRPHGFEKWMAVWSGGQNVQRQMHDAGLRSEWLPEMERARKAAVKAANDSKTPSGRRVNGGALKTAETVLTSARYALLGHASSGGSRKTSVDAFRVAVEKKIDANGCTVTFSLWALNPASAFSDLTGPGPNAARSVVLTSGTLAPLESFASELGAPFPIRMEAPHCVDVQTQVWCGAVASGANDTRLSGTFKTSAEFAYQDDLGASLEKWCLEIPHGVLVFFPSYSALDRVVQRWKSTGAWKKLEGATGKKLFQEPRGGGDGGDRGGGGNPRGGKGKPGRGGREGHESSGGSLDAFLSKYYRAVRLSVSSAPHPHAPAPANSACRGAVLLAVCRGKISEGIDFADANARGVIVVGIPYPNLKDKRVELKRKYNDEHSGKSNGSDPTGVLTGDRWYSQQAFRALNQAVGRCLRHRNDHGAVLLVDARYAHGVNGALIRNLPKWLRPATRKCADFDESVSGLRSFFDDRAKHPPKASASNDSLRAKLLPSVGGSGGTSETRDPGDVESKRGAGKASGKENNAANQSFSIKKFFQPAPLAATAAPETRSVRFARESETNEGETVSIHDTVSIEPGANARSGRSRWRSAPIPRALSPSPLEEVLERAVAPPSALPDPAPGPAPVPFAFERMGRLREVAPELPLVTSPVADLPSPAHAREAPAPVPEPAPGFGRARATPRERSPDLTAELTEDVFAWGDADDAAREEAPVQDDVEESVDDAELFGVWGETPGTQGFFGARGWGATQQFRNFAPAPEKRKPLAASKRDADPRNQDPTPPPMFDPTPLVGSGFGLAVACRWCGSPSVASAPVRRVAVRPETGAATYLAYLAAANETETALATGSGNVRRPSAGGSSPPSSPSPREGMETSGARLYLPGEPFPFGCARAVETEHHWSTLLDRRAAPSRASVEGAWSARDGCYFVPLRCRTGKRWVGARVEATDGNAFARLEASADESDVFPLDGAPRSRQVAVVPGCAFLLEDASVPRDGADGRATADAASPTPPRARPESESAFLRRDELDGSVDPPVGHPGHREDASDGGAHARQEVSEGRRSVAHFHHHGG
jgi:Fanconi anemia group J protein